MKAKQTIHIPLGTRLMRIERMPRETKKFTTTENPYPGKIVTRIGEWIIWIATSDFIHGTFMRLHDNGKVERVTIREGEGDEVLLIRPADAS